MTVPDARVWLVRASLSISTATFVFLLLAPNFAYPLRFAESLRLIEIVTPVFIGFLVIATRWLFSSSTPRTRTKSQQMLSLLVKGPIFACLAGLVAAFTVFGYSNRAEANVGDGMSLDILAALISAAMSGIMLVTAVIAERLFSSEVER